MTNPLEEKIQEILEKGYNPDPYRFYPGSISKEIMDYTKQVISEALPKENDEYDDEQTMFQKTYYPERVKPNYRTEFLKNLRDKGIIIE